MATEEQRGPFLASVLDEMDYQDAVEHRRKLLRSDRTKLKSSEKVYVL